MKIDLHVHSNASDGKLSPREIIDLAIKNKVQAIALTDHDTVGGLKEAENYSLDKPLEFIPGIEFSANPGPAEKELHLVGLFVDYTNPELIRLLEKQQGYKLSAIKEMIKKLNQIGYPISFKELQDESGNESYGRPAIARGLMKKYPEFKDKKQIFDELLGKKGKAFVKYECADLEEIVKAVHSSGGIAIIAHPGYLENSDKIIADFIKVKGDGIEVECLYDHLENRTELINKFRLIAEKKRLLISGGTDFHEDKGNNMIGSSGITKKEFEIIKKYHQSQHQ